MNVLRQAGVYVRDRFAGLIQETDEGYRFTYDPAYLASEKPNVVSLTLPLREESYTSSTLFPFFDGLIPEGWLLEAVMHNWKIDRQDRFGLLLIACKDAIGNVVIREERL